MAIDKERIRTQDEVDEPSAMDQTNERLEAKMKLIESQAKEQVAQGLQNERLEREARRLKKEAERALEEADTEDQGS
jgi:hypothetical protein